MKYTSPCCLLLSLLLLVSCGQKHNTSTGWSDTALVDVLVVGDGLASSDRNYVGNIGSQQEMTLSFPIGGTLTKVTAKNGSRVAAGQLLAEVDATTAKSLHASALASLRQAEDAHRRLQAVHDEGGISEVKWIEMETNLEKARQAEVSARKHLEDCSIRAPFSGILSCSDRHVGQDLKPAEPFGRLLDMNRLRVNFSVPEQEISRINVGDTASATIPALADRQLSLRITDKSILANPMGHTYQVHASIIGGTTSDLLPDMVAKIHLSLGSSHGISIPADCIQTMPEGTTVWVITNGLAARRTVSLGEFSGNNVLVVDGLSNGDTVVSSGKQKLYTGAKVKCN